LLLISAWKEQQGENIYDTIAPVVQFGDFGRAIACARMYRIIYDQFRDD
jgi:hypothetical protein